MDNKVLFMTADFNLTIGWIIGINSSSYAVTDVLKLDGGTNKLIYGKC